MLTEERQDEIVKIVNASGAISVQELVNFLDISESTARRDAGYADSIPFYERLFWCQWR